MISVRYVSIPALNLAALPNVIRLNGSNSDIETNNFVTASVLM